jgi:hypothetical protein
MSNKQRLLIETSKTIYDGYGFDDCVGLKYFGKFVDSLREFEVKDVLVHHIKTYSFRYVFEFLLSSPSLWIDLSASDWVEVMGQVNPRPDPIITPSADECFYVNT